MPRVPLSDVEGNVFFRAMGHRIEIAEDWAKLDGLIRFTGELDPYLKEEVRRSLALGIGCRFCASLGDPEPEKHDKRTALAVAFSQSVFADISDLHGLDDEHFDVLRTEFSNAEIVELVCWILFLVAAQGFGAIMKLPEATSTELDDYLEWRAAGSAQAA
jgi:alkylhydroperoxidase family enzyme